MYLNLENSTSHSIEAYDDTGVIINTVCYKQSLIISPQDIISHWEIHAIEEMNDNHLALLLQTNPEIILIGQAQPGQFLPNAIREFLASQSIGIETTFIGAACSTFNILLNENRRVTLGIIR